jgi:hypothetical protein
MLTIRVERVVDDELVSKDFVVIVRSMTALRAKHKEISERSSTPGIEMTIILAVFKPSPMRMKFYCLAVVALSMWLGGFGCALCCATGVTESCCLDEHNSTDCGVKSCCTRDEDRSSSKSRVAISQQPGVIGCSLLPDHTRSLAPLVRVGTELPDGILGFSSPLAVIGALPVAPSIDPPLPLNRGGTYLRCCVLLI